MVRATSRSPSPTARAGDRAGWRQTAGSSAARVHEIGGVSRAGLARLNPDFGVAARNLGCDGSRAVALRRRREALRGRHVQIRSADDAQEPAAFDAATGDSSALVLSANAAVYDLLYDDGKAHAAGDFTTIGSAPRNFVATLDTGHRARDGVERERERRPFTRSRSTAARSSWAETSPRSAARRVRSARRSTPRRARHQAVRARSPARCAIVLPARRPCVGGHPFTKPGGPAARLYAAAFDRHHGLLPWNPRADNLDAVHDRDRRRGILLGGTFRAVGDSVRNSARADWTPVTGAPAWGTPPPPWRRHQFAALGHARARVRHVRDAGGVRRDRGRVLTRVTGLPTA